MFHPTFTARRLLLSCCCAVALAAASTTAAADEPTQATAPRWYGYQTLIVDGAVTAMLVAGAERGASSLAYASLATYLIVPPLIHAAHHRPGTMALDLFLRVGFPAATGAAFGLVAYEVSSSNPCTAKNCGFASPEFYALGLGIVGATLGALAASAVDASVLAREPRRVSDAPRWSATVAPVKGGATAGVVGTF